MKKKLAKSMIRAFEKGRAGSGLVAQKLVTGPSGMSGIYLEGDRYAGEAQLGTSKDYESLKIRKGGTIKPNVQGMGSTGAMRSIPKKTLKRYNIGDIDPIWRVPVYVDDPDMGIVHTDTSFYKYDSTKPDNRGELFFSTNRGEGYLKQ